MRELRDITNDAMRAIREITRHTDGAHARTAALEKIGALLACELEQLLPEVCVLDTRDRRRTRHVGS